VVATHSLKFDGTTAQWARVESVASPMATIDGTADFSIQLWYKHSADQGMIVGAGKTTNSSSAPTFMVNLTATNELDVMIGTTSPIKAFGNTSSSYTVNSSKINWPFEADKWCHIVLTYRASDGRRRAFFDGRMLFDYTTGSWYGDNGSGSSTYGCVIASLEKKWTGSYWTGGSSTSFSHAMNISNLAMWTAELSPKAVYQLWNGMKGSIDLTNNADNYTSSTSLVAWYKMSSGAETTDSSTNNYPLTLVGSPTTEAWDVAKPTFSSVSIASDNLDTTKAVAGDVVTVTFTSNEALDASTVAVTIAGSTASATNTSGNTWTGTLTLGSIQSGTILFTIDADDGVGNSSDQTTATTDGTAVVYTRTYTYTSTKSIYHDGSNSNDDLRAKKDPPPPELDLSGSDKYSMVFWVKFDHASASSYTRDYFLIRKAASTSGSNNQFTLNLEHNGSSGFDKLEWSAGGSRQTATSGTNIISDGNWHQIVVTNDGGNDGASSIRSDVYLDGSLVGSNIGVYYDYDVSDIYKFSVGGYSYCWVGWIAEVAVYYDHELSATEVTAIYNSGSPVDLNATITNYPQATIDKMVAWWRMGDGIEGSTIDTIYSETSYGAPSDFNLADHYMADADIVSDAP
jgi:hypothetical protein